MRTIAAISAGGLALVSLGLAAPANAAAAKPPKMTVIGHETSFKWLHDAPPAGPSKGDKAQYTENLFLKNKKVGRDVVQWTIVSNSRASETGTFTFNNGAVHAKGSYSTVRAHPITLTISGGSGAFAGAHGKVTLVETSETAQKITFTFS